MGARAVPHILRRLIDREGDAIRGQDSAIDRERLKLFGDANRIARQAENEPALPLEPHARPQYVPVAPALSGISGEGSMLGPGPHDAPGYPKVRGGFRERSLGLRVSESQQDHAQIIGEFFSNLQARTTSISFELEIGEELL